MRKLNFFNGEYYHLFNRGVDKRNVFDEESDYQRLQAVLYLANNTIPLRYDNLTKYQRARPELFSLTRSEPLIAIHAYSLLPNHFHLLVQQLREDGISKFMHRLSTAYTMYYNTKNNRSGALFQGPFKSVHIDTDRQLRYTFAYVHANPSPLVKENDHCSINDAPAVLVYPYASTLEYQNVLRPENSIVEKGFFEAELGGTENLLKQFEVWLSYHSESNT